MESEKSESSPSPKRRWRRAAVTTSVLGGMLFSGLAVLPFAVMNSTHRDEMLNSRFEPLGLTIVTESGSGSWVTPVVLSNVKLKDKTGRVQCVIKEIRTSRTVTGLVLNGGDLGKITIVQPNITVQLDDEGKFPPGLFANDLPDDPSQPKPNVAFEIIDAGFTLSVPWRSIPIVELFDVDIAAAISNKEDGRWLEVSPVQLMDKQAIDDRHSQQNLAFIAPVLSLSTDLAGEASVQLHELSVRLDAKEDKSIRASGEAVFHSVEARLEKDWVVQISRMLGQSIGANLPDRLQIARDSRVDFAVDEQGVHHTGLAFLLPEIVGNMNIQSSGTVGLDETLDLAMNVQLPQLGGGNAFMSLLSQMTQLPYTLQVKGTVAEPKLVMPKGFSLADQMAHNMNPENPPSEPPSVANSVFDLIGSASSPDPQERTGGILGGVLNLIRAGERAKENAPPKPPKPLKEERKRKRKNRNRKDASLEGDG